MNIGGYMILVATLDGGLRCPKMIDGTQQLWFRCSRSVLKLMSGVPVMKTETQEFQARNIQAIKYEDAAYRPEWQGWTRPIPVWKSLIK
jgi:hypothetical protein